MDAEVIVGKESVVCIGSMEGNFADEEAEGLGLVPSQKS